MGRALVMLALVFCAAGARSNGLQMPMHRWIDANTKAIAHIRDAKKRLREERMFLRTPAALASQESAVHNVVPRHSPQLTARLILSNTRLYRFTQSSADQPPTWWQRVLDWIGDRLSRIVHALFGGISVPARASRGVADALLALCIAVFLVLFARVAWLYGRNTRAVFKAQPIVTPEEPSSLVSQSMKAAESGDYTRAIARLFAAALAVLALRGHLEARRGETLGEIGRRVRSSDPRLGASFGELTAALTRILYAERPAESEDWGRSLGAYRQLEALLGL